MFTLSYEGQPTVKNGCGSALSLAGQPAVKLMIINQFDVMGVAFLKAKNNAPVGPHGDRPVSLPVAFEWMEAIAGKIESLRRGGCVEHGQDAFDLIGQVTANLVFAAGCKYSPHPSAVSLFGQPFQPLVFEAGDHCPSV